MHLYIWHMYMISNNDHASSGITRLNDRARQDVAVLGLGFLKLDGTFLKVKPFTANSSSYDF